MPYGLGAFAAVGRPAIHAPRTQRQELRQQAAQKRRADHGAAVFARQQAHAQAVANRQAAHAAHVAAKPAHVQHAKPIHQKPAHLPPSAAGMGPQTTDIPTDATGVDMGLGPMDGSGGGFDSGDLSATPGAPEGGYDTPVDVNPTAGPGAPPHAGGFGPGTTPFVQAPGGGGFDPASFDSSGGSYDQPFADASQATAYAAAPAIDMSALDTSGGDQSQDNYGMPGGDQYAISDTDMGVAGMGALSAAGSSMPTADKMKYILAVGAAGVLIYFLYRKYVK